MISPTEFTYILDRDPEGGIEWDKTIVVLGTAHQGISADVGTAAVVENNRIYNCYTGFYHDTFATKDLTIRNNHFFNVIAGIYQNLDGFSYKDYATKTGFDGVLSTAGQPNPTRVGQTATFKTSVPHGLLPGRGVRIRDVTVGGLSANAFVGDFPIVSVPDATSFTYLMTADPGADADPSSGTPPTPPHYAVKWQVIEMLLENNLIELGFNWHPFGWGSPFGIELFAGNYAPVYTYLRTAIRGNIIRHVNNVIDPTNLPQGIRVYGCETVLVEGNIVDLNPYYRIFFDRSKLVQCFDNNTSSGSLIRAYNSTTGIYTDEISTRLEDALVLSMLQPRRQL